MSEAWVPSWDKPEPESVLEADADDEPRGWWTPSRPLPSAPTDLPDPPWANDELVPIVPAVVENEPVEVEPVEVEPPRRRRGAQGGAVSGDQRRQSGRYVSQYQDSLRADLSNGAIVLAYRVGLAALANCWDDGHSPYPAGGLRRALATVDKRTGELVEPRPDVLSRAIRAAKDEGWIDEASTARCLIVPAERHHRGSGMRGDSRCTVH